MRSSLSLRKVVLFSINLASTFLTLFTGLRENPLVVFILGRYDLIRYRLKKGYVNYNHMRDDLLDKSILPDLEQVGENWRIFSSPTRSPANLGEDRSVCLRVNSMNVTVMTLNFNDFWGRGVRREQRFLFSISPPHCSIINFEPSWVTDNCTATHDNDLAKCHRYILDNFDELYEDRLIQVGVEVDFGTPGSPFMKCIGRPPQRFEFMADLMVQQQYWAGGSHAVEVQTSSCYAMPLLRNRDWGWGLFAVQEKDQTATVITAVDQTSWTAWGVTYLYGIISIYLISHGVFRILVQTKTIVYIPLARRFVKEGIMFRYLFPSMDLASMLPNEDNSLIRFKGRRIMASDIWLNHWLYIAISIIEAVFSVRMIFIVLEMGTWLLSHKASFWNFVFLCSALTRISWLMCLVHTCMRYLIKVVGRVLEVVGVMSSTARIQLELFADGASCFLSYKIYSVTLCMILYSFLKLHGGTTFQKADPPYKRGSYGGNSNVHQFWGSEVVCDLLVIFSCHTVCGVVIGAVLMMTPYRHLVNNSIIRSLQQRYFFVGWDIFVAAETLGMTPFDSTLIKDGVAMTNCTFGCVLQVLYASGPSGLVDLAGDYIFLEGGFSRDPVQYRFTLKRAVEMGLFRPAGVVSPVHVATETMIEQVTIFADRVSSANKGPDNTPTAAKTTATCAATTVATDKIDGRPNKNAPKIDEVSKPSIKPRKHRSGKKSIFDRTLRLVCERTWGRLLFVDDEDPGTFARSQSTNMNEYVTEDAITFLNIHDVHAFLGSERQLHIC